MKRQSTENLFGKPTSKINKYKEKIRNDKREAIENPRSKTLLLYRFCPNNFIASIAIFRHVDFYKIDVKKDFYFKFDKKSLFLF